MYEMLKTMISPVAREGWPYVGICALVTVLLTLSAAPVGWIAFLVTLWCAWFFRDPKRMVPNRPGLMVSPADGLVQSIDVAVPPAELGMGEEERIRIAVTLHIFNVHVNRVPTAGRVLAAVYRPGAYINTTLDKASEQNERQAVCIGLPDGRDLAMVQIAGVVARRIVCNLKEGQDVETGQRFGMIRFGSRVDVYLPQEAMPLVCRGQTMVAGETVIADLLPHLHAEETERSCIVR